MRARRLQILFLSAVAFVIGIFIVITVRANNIPVLKPDPRNQELIRSISSLQSDIAALEDERNSIDQQLTDIHANQAEGESNLGLERQALDTVRQDADLTELQGPGVIVSIDDNKEGADKAKAGSPETFFPENYIVHDKDLLYIVRALAPYAEAMAVNNVRLNDSSQIRCVGTVIMVNYAILAPPYEIRALGNPDNLMQALQASSRYQSLLNKMMPIKASTTDDMTLPAYSGTYAPSFSKLGGV